MFKYVIFAPSLKINSGGVTVLHLLCDYINRLGYEAYLWPSDNNFDTFLTNAKYKISLANYEILSSKFIAIYPEIIIGNPLNAKYVVRWILNKPGVLGGDGNFGNDDLLFYYSKSFTNGQKNVNYLQIIELYGDMFNNKNLKRSGSCYVMRKGKNRKIIHDLNESIEIIDSTPSQELVEIFNKTKYFYSYDYATFLSIQAALCGCISIVVPFEGTSANQWMSLSETRKFGIAYGEENIEHAVETMHLVRPQLKNLEQQFLNNVKNFIEHTQNYANGKFLSLFKNNNPNYWISNYELTINEAENFLEMEEYSNAEKKLIGLLEDFPHDIKILNHLTLISIKKNNFNRANELINLILELDKTNNTANDNLEYIQNLKM